MYNLIIPNHLYLIEPTDGLTKVINPKVLEWLSNNNITYYTSIMLSGEYRYTKLSNYIISDTYVTHRITFSRESEMLEFKLMWC